MTAGHDVRDPHDGGGLLVPLLPTAEGPPDAVAVAAWHLALSNLVGVEVPHDLLGLWLFPARGGVQLLAPSELAGDRVEVPVPRPFLAQGDLFALEERVRHAGYRSAVAIPVRAADRDLGLALFAGLDSGMFDVQVALRLHAITRNLVPTFEGLSDKPPGVGGIASGEGETGIGLLTGVAQAAAESRDAGEFLRMVSGALAAGVPHEQLEIVVQGARPGTWALLGQAGGRWGERTRGLDQAVAAILATRTADEALLIDDVRSVGEWPTRSPARAAQRVRAVLGVELSVAGAAPAWLLLGGPAVGMFSERDAELAGTVAPIIAVRVHAFRQTLSADVGQAQLSAVRAAQPLAARLVTVLAEEPHWGHALKRATGEICDTLGYSTARLILLLGENRVVTVEPGDIHPLADVPSEPLDFSPLAGLLRGTVTFVVGDTGGTLAVPLRVAGRPIGALELRGQRGEAGAPVTAAAQAADALAPHVELVRRAALGGRPTPGRPALPTEEHRTGR